MKGCNFLERPKKSLLVILLAGLLFSVLVLLFCFLKNNQNLEYYIPASAEPNLISIAGVPDIKDIYVAAAGLVPIEGSGEVKAGLFPHHTLIANELSEYWQKLAAQINKPSIIVIIGPAHDNQGSVLVQSASWDFQTDFGVVKTDNKIINKLVGAGVVSDEPSSFTNEHSVGTHLPFIAKLFPDVSIVPIIAKSPAVESEARDLVSALQENLPDDALVIFSLDCSHGLGSKKAFVNDARTLSLIEAKNFSAISILDETFIDSPFTLQAYLLWVEAQGLEGELVWHEHIGRLIGTENDPGTSYLIFFAAKKEIFSLKISAVGDVMLSRAVGSKLYSVPVEQAFAGVYGEFLDSDLVFGNLESVLATSTLESTKEIRFQADPARIDVLGFLSFSHLSVINNHNGDYGQAAWEESVENLRAAGISPIGGYRNDGETVFLEINGKRMAFLAFDTTIYNLTPESLTEQISQAAAVSDITIVSFHWGAEYQHFPNTEQKELAHTAIEAGADIVIGHHPHVLQGIEKYQNGLIFYSLGNFIFDQFGEDENESLIVHLEFNEVRKSLELVPARIEGYFPRVATEEEREVTLGRLAGWSDFSLNEEIKSGSVTW
ncbi:MAG: hypothetical protein UX09_C0007G0008 [Candidatus Uhrbacteria bacterium GW2011_GWE2_45_35]|uniref:Capsule synthesis protein CapA domain-containing protein n=2 Tax=Candidatus Uhriibacteriota TaxID=1752732 RepID=A0A0G1MEK9_9BACT|nr:MAG: hypothetical protein UW63_C0027G0005 [Candidatus Uhrbacteria bacterium GW2011_GWF2_44_350]KKU08982.1 MAG: hypothetical protein UX09_C0007G0008 [Candidatus Uhrbacteria bacterium GW2011_GWE2_45_35]HBR81070.1 AmmeMemoRadiSam system protein B [Candidatus Uhrbacteria bacterium]